THAYAFRHHLQHVFESQDCQSLVQKNAALGTLKTTFNTMRNQFDGDTDTAKHYWQQWLSVKPIDPLSLTELQTLLARARQAFFTATDLVAARKQYREAVFAVIKPLFAEITHHLGNPPCA